MKFICEKYGKDDFAVYGQYCYDVQEGEKLTNKEIAHKLHKMGYIDDQGLPKIPNLNFLEKIDVNGTEMHDLYRFLKRNTS